MMLAQYRCEVAGELVGGQPADIDDEVEPAHPRAQSPAGAGSTDVDESDHGPAEHWKDKCQDDCCSGFRKAVRFAPRMSTAERKQQRRQRRQATKAAGSDAFETILEKAKSGYELFHQLPTGSCTKEQMENSSTGILGWAQFEELTRSGGGSMCDLVPAPALEISASGPSAVDVPSSKLVWSKHVVTTVALSDALSGTEGEKHVDVLTKATTSAARTVSNVNGQPSAGWELIEITVDSGSCDTALPSNMLSSVALTPTENVGEEYEVADGHLILNEGEKRCVMMTQGSVVPKGTVFQVSKVHKPLMSVGAMADAGYECLLGKEGGFMRDVDTGEKIPLIRRGNLYVLRAWVKAADSDFGRPS